MSESVSIVPVSDQIARFRERFTKIVSEVGRRIVGQDDIVRDTVTGLLAGGHVLLEGIPGVGKTSLVRTLAECLHLRFTRIQFTPDLMPADIIGTHIVQEQAHGGAFLEFQPGPVFANVILADEINRATPRTQSALLEAMQDASVSVGKTTHELEQPFFVLATQNPLDMEGTYPLPEAQLDRFFFKLRVGYPTRDALHQILDRTTQDWSAPVSRVADAAEILEMRHTARALPIARPVQDYAVRLTLGTHPDSPHATSDIRAFVRYGASPRAAQALVLGAKIHALTHGASSASEDDVRAIAVPAMRHRMILNFEGEVARADTDTLIADLLKATPGAASDRA
jgi:MoxR-like ATPase